MVFSSFAFLCFFLPVIIILHSLVKNKVFRNGLLILASLFFYAYGEPVYVILLLISVLLNYLFGLVIDKTHSKVALTFAVILNIGALVYFKYTAFLIGLIVPFLNDSVEVPSIALPIGISFYTFQALSYIVDVYRSSVKVQKNFFSLLLYISFFPQLIAGPIVKYHDIEKNIELREVTFDKMKSGMFRFSQGLFKKIMISNVVALVADNIFALSDEKIGLFAAWLGAFTYLMQIYFDFSGYSDMAIGLGKMFGFEFLENFNYPYMADSIQEFWHRWHISLSTWFKEYLYIPLGGNRKGAFRTYLNRYIVFFATGFWHGANWTFIVWGLFHGTFLVLESSGIIPIKKCKVAFIRHIYAVLLVMIGFVIFRADNIHQALVFLSGMIGVNGIGYIAGLLQYLSPYYVVMFIIAAICCTDIVKKMFLSLCKKNEWPKMVLSIAALILCLLSLASESYNPFIYFRF